MDILNNLFVKKLVEDSIEMTDNGLSPALKFYNIDGAQMTGLALAWIQFLHVEKMFDDNMKALGKSHITDTDKYDEYRKKVSAVVIKSIIESECELPKTFRGVQFRLFQKRTNKQALKDIGVTGNLLKYMLDASDMYVNVTEVTIDITNDQHYECGATNYIAEHTNGITPKHQIIANMRANEHDFSEEEEAMGRIIEYYHKAYNTQVVELPEWIRNHKLNTFGFDHMEICYATIIKSAEWQDYHTREYRLSHGLCSFTNSMDETLDLANLRKELLSLEEEK